MKLMQNNSDKQASAIRESLKLAWGDCYHHLIPKDATNPLEELEVYKAWLEWFEAGQMATNPLTYFVLGYTIRDGVIEEDISEKMEQYQQLYSEQGYLAVKELVEELERDDDE